VPDADLNRLTGGLSELCHRRAPDEKWLLAPSLRVGFGWLDSVARSGRPLINVRVKTLGGMALELTQPEMARLGLEYLQGAGGEVLLAGILERLRDKGGGYLSGLDASQGLTRAVLGSINNLRMAGLAPGDLDVGDFEVELKGRQVRTLLREYEKELIASGLVDYAGALTIATRRLAGERPAITGGTLVILPGDMEAELKGLERALWSAIPEESRVVLPVDQPGEEGGRDTDAALLGWVLDPTAAPEPAGDGTAGLFRATGEVNEVREVFGRCARNGIPLDEVELIHTDTVTYVPLVYELACRLEPDEAGEVPVTFAEGIPVRYSRPARALLSWLSWIDEEFAQPTLVQMIEYGLLEVGGAAGEAPPLSQLGALLKALPIGGGRERYLEVLDRGVARLEERASGRTQRLRKVRDLARDLLEWATDEKDGQAAVLDGAAAFLEKRARCSGRFDEYCGEFLLEKIGELADCVREGDAVGLKPRVWLAELAGESNAGGQGPRPGRMYVTSLSTGGYSGRAHTFIVGLDDGRFPGTGSQDPILLDGERGRMSDDLSTGAGRLAGRNREFALLLSRLRGTVTLSYSCRDIIDDREAFPSPVILSAYRILSGSHGGDVAGFLEWIPDPVSFAPEEPGGSIDPTGWWLWRRCVAGGVEVPEEAVASQFKNLARGLEARRARESDDFTAYDGYVPRAGKDGDPTSESGPVLSARRLETLGRCPMEYFFRYVLEIEPPEEYQAAPGVWLGASEKGLLLHAVFQEFMFRVGNRGVPPEYGRDIGLLEEILEERIALLKAENPPPGVEVFERERRELLEVVRIFLSEEEECCRTASPAYFEVAIGVPPEEAGTALDAPDPVEIMLPGGDRVRVRGKIDRVDEVAGSGGKMFLVWDYKTGSSYAYDRADPFKGGRHVQNALYLALVESRLGEVHTGAEAVGFGYFFPGIREHGERIRWTKAELDGYGRLVERLCRMAAGGCFPFSNDEDDAGFSDYRNAFGDTAAAAEAIGRKLRNEENDALAAFRELRDIEVGDG